jgi:hypothetical protein
MAKSLAKNAQNAGQSSSHGDGAKGELAEHGRSAREGRRSPPSACRAGG